MVTPSPEGAARVMRLALEAGGTVDYINAHATSTPLGDVWRTARHQDGVWRRRAAHFLDQGADQGHPIAAAGAQEAIFALLMLQHGFVAGCVNIAELDPACAGLPIVAESIDCHLDTVMSNSFGFGGTNACLVFRRCDS